MKFVMPLLLFSIVSSCLNEDEVIRVPSVRSHANIEEEKGESADASTQNSEYFIISEALNLSLKENDAEDYLQLISSKDPIYQIDEELLNLGVTRDLLYSEIEISKKAKKMNCSKQKYSEQVSSIEDLSTKIRKKNLCGQIFVQSCLGIANRSSYSSSNDTYIENTPIKLEWPCKDDNLKVSVADYYFNDDHSQIHISLAHTQFLKKVQLSNGKACKASEPWLEVSASPSELSLSSKNFKGSISLLAMDSFGNQSECIKFELLDYDEDNRKLSSKEGHSDDQESELAHQDESEAATIKDLHIVFSSSVTKITNLNKVEMKVIFSEPVESFHPEDIEISHASVEDFYQESEQVYTFSLTDLNHHVELNIAQGALFSHEGISNSEAAFFSILVDHSSPEVFGLETNLDGGSEQVWTWSCSEECSYRYVIDQEPDTQPTGSYLDHSSAIQSSGDGLYYIHLQARDKAGNESEVVHASALLQNRDPVAQSIPSLISDDAHSKQSPILDWAALEFDFDQAVAVEIAIGYDLNNDGWDTEDENRSLNWQEVPSGLQKSHYRVRDGYDNFAINLSPQKQFRTSIRLRNTHGEYSHPKTSAFWSLKWKSFEWSDDQSLNDHIIPAASSLYTHALSFPAKDPISINGLSFNRGASEGAYQIDALTSMLNNLANDSIGLESDKIEQSFHYGVNPVQLKLFNLDPNKTYTFTWFNGDWTGSCDGSNQLQIEDTDSGLTSELFDRNCHSIQSYSYTGRETLSLQITSSTGSPHLYGFTNKEEPSPSKSLSLIQAVAPLSFWADASDLQSLKQNSDCSLPALQLGDHVKCWQDKSGKQNHMLPVTGNARLETSPDEHAKLYLPEASSLQASNINLDFSKGKDIFLTFQYTSGTGAALNWNTTSPNNSLIPYAMNPAHGTIIGNGASRLGRNDFKYWFGQEHTENQTHIARISANKDSISLIRDGGDTIYSGANYVNSNNILRIGQKLGTSNEFANGYYAELLVFNRELSKTEAQVVEGYLACKWNLRSQLPQEHPYYAFSDKNKLRCPVD